MNSHLSPLLIHLNDLTPANIIPLLCRLSSTSVHEKGEQEMRRWDMTENSEQWQQRQRRLRAAEWAAKRRMVEDSRLKKWRRNDNGDQSSAAYKKEEKEGRREEKNRESSGECCIKSSWMGKMDWTQLYSYEFLLSHLKVKWTTCFVVVHRCCHCRLLPRELCVVCYTYS